MVVLQEREWGKRGWSFSRLQVSPCDGHQVWVLSFVQERIQERAIVKRKKVIQGDTHSIDRAWAISEGESGSRV